LEIVVTLYPREWVGKLRSQRHEDGWLLVAIRRSHRQFKHPMKPDRVTVPGKPGNDLAPGTLNSILKQAGLRRN
jgi:predicted RNA binding protein YcfA (HicA-like mRNA interferase family)